MTVLLGINDLFGRPAITQAPIGCSVVNPTFLAPLRKRGGSPADANQDVVPTVSLLLFHRRPSAVVF